MPHFPPAAAERAADTVTVNGSHPPIPEAATDKALARFDAIRNAKGKTLTAEIRISMQKTMQQHAAVFRSSKSLTEGVKKMDQVAASMQQLRLADQSLIWNTDLVEAIELDNLMSQALVTVRSAEARHESRGAHAHEDYPDRDDKNWMKHSLVWLDETNTSRLAHRPVTMTPLTNEVDSIPPMARVY